MFYGARLLGLGFALCPLPAVSSQVFIFHFLCLHLFISVGRSRNTYLWDWREDSMSLLSVLLDKPSCMCCQSSSMSKHFLLTLRNHQICPSTQTFHWHIYILSYFSLPYQLSGSFPIFSSLFTAKCLKRILYVYPSVSHFLWDPLLGGWFFFFSLLLHQTTFFRFINDPILPTPR